MKLRTILAAGIVALLAQPAFSQVPQHLNHQGRVAVQGTNFNGTGQFKFALVTRFNQNQTATAIRMNGIPVDGIGMLLVNNPGSGYVTPPTVTITDVAGTGATAEATIVDGAVTAITVTNQGSNYSASPTVTLSAPPENIQYFSTWSNDQTSMSGGEPTAAVSLPVVNGLYSVQLGDTAAGMSEILPGVFHGPRFLRVWFNDGVNGFQQLTPDQPLAAAPYAFRAIQAEIADTVADGAITYGKLGVGAVVGDRIGIAAIMPQHLNNGAVTAAKLAAGAITPLSLDTGVTAPAPGQVLSFTNDGLRWVSGGGLPLIGNQSLVGPLIDVANTGAGIGLRSISALHDGVNARTDGVGKSGVFALATGVDSAGVHGASDLHHGVYAYTGSTNRAAIWANAPNGAEAIHGHSDLGDGVFGYTHGVGKSGIFGWNDVEVALFGAPAGQGVFGYASHIGIGVLGVSEGNDGISGRTNANNHSGVFGYSERPGSSGVNGTSLLHHGVYAFTGSVGSPALWAHAPNGAEAVHAHSELNDGAVGYTNGAGKAGVYGWTNRSDARGGFFGNYNGGEALRTAGRAVIDGDLAVRGTATVRVLRIDNGIDIAEPFMIKKDEEFPRGSVMVISDEREGELQLASREYDTRVAGIISGANGINPGLQLTQKGFNDVGGQPVALTGRVYCRADASNGAIKPGDLLTTSANPGHAMKASDHSRTQGAVLGKAMSTLDEGTGFVLVLVTLQ